MLDGLARILDVLHDISDSASTLVVRPTVAKESDSPVSPTAIPKLYTAKELAELLGVSRSTVYSWRDSGHGPTATKVGSVLRYQQADVDEWLAECREREAAVPQPWRDAFTQGRVGSSHPASSEVAEKPWCKGSHSEPRAASQFTGRGVCRACGDDVLINRDGRLRKHRRWVFS